jgi:lysophospholipase L1-like esterase
MNTNLREWRLSILAVVVVLSCSFILFQKQKPVLYIIGDSTVKNGSGTGQQNLWGWGSFIAGYFDTTKISVENHAIGGRSSRTFITDGRWDRILERLKPGDFVIMQFGHNDAGPLDDTARARGTIRGIGNDSAAIYNPIRKINEVVYSYGHYMRKYVDDAKAKGAIPIICSPVPRDNFREGKTVRADSTYGGWAQTVARSNGALFIPLNNLVADRYDAMGQEKVHAFFPVDHTHPDKAGSELTASIVVGAVRKLNKCKLKNYLKK